MRSLVFSLVALALCGTAALAQLALTGAGSTAASGGGGFTGPSNVSGYGTPWAFYSFRAISTTYATNNSKLFNAIRASDSHTCDFNAASSGGVGLSANCSTGGDNGSTLSAWLNATTGKVVTFYDQSGNAKDVTQGTDSKRAAITLSCNGALPCATFSGASSELYSNASSAPITTASTTTMLLVLQQTSANASKAYVYNQRDLVGGAWFILGESSSANTATEYDGTFITATMSDNAWHVEIGLINGASSLISVDGTETTGDAGSQTQGIQSRGIGLGGQYNDAQAVYFTGKFEEAGDWFPLAASAAQRKALCTNVSTYWGITASC